jgi:hypothetical protein
VTVDGRQQSDLDMATPTAKAEDRLSAGFLVAYCIDGDVTAALREISNSPRDVAAVGGHRVLRAELGCDGERLEIPIHRDHSGTQRTGDHDHAQPDAAGTHDGHPLSRCDPCTADQGAVRRGEPAPKTRGSGEVDLVRETHQVRICSVQDDVLRERSPVCEAWLVLSRADLSVPRPTPLAATATADERDRHPIPDSPTADLFTELDHHPGKFVTRHVREGDLLVARPRVPIATAQSRRHHPDHNPANRGPELGDLPYLRLGSNGIQDNGSHRYSLPVSSLRVSGRQRRLPASSRPRPPRDSATRCSRPPGCTTQR